MIYVYNDGGRASSGFKGRSGDCACRAISIATGKPYADVYAAINELAKRERTGKRKRRISSARTGVYRQTVDKYLTTLGWRWVPTMRIGSGCKVHLTADELPAGNRCGGAVHATDGGRVMSNIVERLRQRALSRVGGVKMNGPHLRTDGWQAADTIERLRAALREIRREARTVGYDYGNDKIVSIVDTALAETDPAIPSRPRDGGADIEAAAEEPESDPNYQRDIDQLGALGI